MDEAYKKHILNYTIFKHWQRYNRNLPLLVSFDYIFARNEILRNENHTKPKQYRRKEVLLFRSLINIIKRWKIIKRGSLE